MRSWVEGCARQLRHLLRHKTEMKDPDVSILKEETDMARKGQDSSKFKGDKQPLEADVEGDYYAPADYTSNPQEYEGECEPAPQPAPYQQACALEADDTICGGSLRVTAYVDCDDEDNDDPHTDSEGEEGSEARYLQGVEIRIQGPGIIDTELTNADGFVTWDGLPPGEYRVTAFIPPGYNGV